MKWYYSFNNTTYGPVDEVKLLKLYEDEVVESTTLVRPEGTTKWISFDKTGILSTNKKEYVKPEELRGTFIWFLVFFAFSALWIFFDRFIYPFGLDATPGMQTVLQAARCFLFIPMGISTILTYVLLYEYWKTIQNEHSTVTPGKAVGFLFIPIFNLFWTFKAHWGFSKQANKYARQLMLGKPGTSVRLSKQWISFLYSLFLSVGYVVSVIVFRFIQATTPEITEAISFSSSAQYFSVMKPYLIPLAIQYLLNLVIELTMMVDFYLTAQSILIAIKQKGEEVN